jgi:prepilin signal peptidase PulO-like enzyme (type II secretory pathway)
MSRPTRKEAWNIYKDLGLLALVNDPFSNCEVYSGATERHPAAVPVVVFAMGAGLMALLIITAAILIAAFQSSWQMMAAACFWLLITWWIVIDQLILHWGSEKIKTHLNQAISAGQHRYLVGEDLAAADESITLRTFLERLEARDEKLRQRWRDVVVRPELEKRQAQQSAAAHVNPVTRLFVTAVYFGVAFPSVALIGYATLDAISKGADDADPFANCCNTNAWMEWVGQWHAGLGQWLETGLAQPYWVLTLYGLGGVVLAAALVKAAECLGSMTQVENAMDR